VTRHGGREGDVFYRDRWSHDKVVRSTHGVNCTGSCSWKVYVKDGIITWETQQTDYPSVGPDSPEYEPRGCPRGAAFSWYTYSPTRCATRTSAASCSRCTARPKARTGDPVLAWAASWDDPASARAYQAPAARAAWSAPRGPRSTRSIAAAHVHTIKQHGPDRIFGFSPIPAMSMASHAAGSRFISLIGGAMLSFYDWYATCRWPPRRCSATRPTCPSPRTGGTRLPDHVGLPTSRDPHPGRALHGRGPLPRPEGRHGVPGLRGQHEVRRRVDPRTPAPTAPWHGDGPRDPQGVLRRPAGAAFFDYVKKYTDLPFLVTLRDEKDGAYVPGQVPHRRRPR
jgi:nitrate reductase alpha subunit